MNSLKTLFIIAVLGAGAYGVHLSLSRTPETSETPEPGLAESGAPHAPLLLGPESAIPPYPPNTPLGADLSTAPLGTAPLGTASLGTAPPGSAPPGTAAQTSLQAPLSSADTAAEGIAVPYVYGGSTTVPHELAPPPGAMTGVSDPPASTSPAADPAGHHAAGDEFTVLMQAVAGLLDENRLAEAHLTLSSLYGDPRVPPEYVQNVIDLLDQLAGTVVYSRQHLLEPPYRVQQGDTLERIAAVYEVPPQLLARINGIRDPLRLSPGQELKVVRGPFDALVDLDKYELTLMLGNCYAGRFPIGVGRDHLRLDGSYIVLAKAADPAYYGPDVNIAPNDPNNPLGEYWIDLGNQIGIHGTNNPQNLHETTGRGSICLGNRDIEDLFGILSVGSRVVIRR